MVFAKKNCFKLKKKQIVILTIDGSILNLN